jgi:hypothetical protein
MRKKLTVELNYDRLEAIGEQQGLRSLEETIEREMAALDPSGITLISIEDVEEEMQTELQNLLEREIVILKKKEFNNELLDYILKTAELEIEMGRLGSAVQELEKLHSMMK